ncbi:MAG: hypothetical protein WCT14_21175 [Treponemataceae bacterium]
MEDQYIDRLHALAVKIYGEETGPSVAERLRALLTERDALRETKWIDSNNGNILCI